MRDLILEYVNKVNYQPKTFEELVLELNINEDELDEFHECLMNLIDEYEIFLNKKKDRVLSPRLQNMYKGIISVKSNFQYGFIKSSLPFDVYVNKNNLGEAFNGDEVLFSLTGFDGFNNKSDEAIVKKVIKRKTVYLVGTVYKHNNLLCLEHNEKGFPKIVRLKSTDKIKCNQIVRVKVSKYNEYMCDATITDVIGDNSEIGMDITKIALIYNFKREFEDSVLKEAQDLNYNFNEKNKRVDYTNEFIFTIDGVDAKDLDDAVSVKKLDNGNYQLGVYIADVSYYVKEDSLLDKEAYNRGTSVYLVDRVIPMLPYRLSNDLCSLNPDEEKLVISCIMEINEYGEVIESSINEGIIKTVKRLNYRDCNLVLENGINAVPDYDDVYPHLVLMEELAQKLYEKKHNRGALDFDMPESKVILDDNGKVKEIATVERGISEHIIEEFMIVANETVAEFIENLNLPFIYRVHDEPDKLKFQSLKMIVSSLGYRIKSMHPAELQKLLEYIEDSSSYLKTLILRLMAKAVYSEENIGHFGLASKSYTHFTSPIRRYPDLIVHRLIRKYLFNHDINADEFLVLTQKISEIAKHSSEKEREAFECEMKVLDMKKAEYMEQFIGEKFTGTVSSVTKFGVFVTIEGDIDGLVHASNMDGDYYEYDSYNNQFVGKRSNKKIKMGEEVDVILLSASKETSEIDFKLVYNNSKEKHSYYKKKQEDRYGKNQKSRRKGGSVKKNKNYR